MGDLAGWVLLGIVVLVLAYILPVAIRSRQVVVDSRVDDRYSGDLRVVATAGHRPVATPGSTRVLVHQRLNEEHPMKSQADRLLAASDARRLAAARAARAAASSSRAAAARRRLLLTVAVAGLTVAGWVGWGLLSWPMLAGIVPAVALVGVIALGRRAAALGAAADARWEREIAQITAQAHRRSASKVRASGRPRLRVDVDPTTLVTDAAPAPEKPAETPSEPASWTPVPVPPPAYTLKQSAPRRQVSPLVMDAPTERMDPVAEPAPGAAPAEERSAEPAAETTTPVAPAMDVQAVLARRRAAG